MVARRTESGIAFGVAGRKPRAGFELRGWALSAHEQARSERCCPRCGVRKPKSTASVGRATRGVTFFTGMLIALERRHAGALALLRACRLSRASITIPAAVVAEWWRGTERALLESGRVEALTPELAEHAGELLATTAGSNAVDATVIASAALRGDLVITGDVRDLRDLAALVPGVSVARLR